MNVEFDGVTLEKNIDSINSALTQLPGWVKSAESIDKLNAGFRGFANTVTSLDNLAHSIEQYVGMVNDQCSDLLECDSDDSVSGYLIVFDQCIDLNARVEQLSGVYDSAINVLACYSKKAKSLIDDESSAVEKSTCSIMNAKVSLLGKKLNKKQSDMNMALDSEPVSTGDNSSVYNQYANALADLKKKCME
ncbi:hypothetical protein HOK51_02180 [Candidatus Woesearchaeota archaeon]|jgi:hypothetical protein|nr:hypothetical protein [Candidatus Woesearchaeota archaeon]MBT6518624.1 hypothetical protein [Candidatus Woesearchaeota archaeon]MBT7368051.1 hypothetical protein [Candidatus Woesearchaeota archaeon]